jgi:hypothetical protein
MTDTFAAVPDGLDGQAKDRTFDPSKPLLTDHGLGESNYHFYRCDKCASLLTFDDEVKSRTTGQICGCGSGKYFPTNPTDAEWELPKVKAYCAAHDLEPCLEAQL